jgi:NAD(P)-dependent dehydrogenase (short-subunit alcohol dehydrogenase family)
MNVLITGCSSGIGLLTAVAFARRGDQVSATMRSASRAGALLEAAEAAGVTGQIEIIEIDVTSTESVDAGVAGVLDRYGSIDVLVNNAGIEIHGAVYLAGDSEVLAQFDTNVFGVIRMCRSVVPAMIAAGAGRIINVGSVAGQVGPPYAGLYAASKHAIEGLSESMHFELAHRGIDVVVIEPGQFETELTANSSMVAAMTPGSDDHDRFLAFRNAQRGLVEGQRPGAEPVAEAIVAAATVDSPRLRWVVGDDARTIIETKSQMGFEEFEVTMRAVLDWHD